MSNYLERFRSMVAEIEAHPLLEVVTFSINPPISEQVLAQIETGLGLQLAESIRSFYQEANGLRIYWRFRLDLTDEELDRIEETYDDYEIGLLEEDVDEIEGRNPFAQINLLPLEESLVNRDWQGIVYFEETQAFDKSVEFCGSTYQRSQLEMRLKPFDLFSYSSCMAFLLETETREEGFKVSRLGDHYIEWQDNRITDFASYLEMLLATRGIVQARESIYQEEGGERLPSLVTAPEYWTEEKIPKLFRYSL